MEQYYDDNLQHSTLSILAIVFSILIFPIGFVLSFIDLVRTDKEHKHTFSVVGLIISILIPIVAYGAYFFGSGAYTSEKTDNDSIAIENFVDDVEDYQKKEKSPKEPIEEQVHEMTEEEFKSTCLAFDYKTIARNPERYGGRNFKVTVQIYDSVKGEAYDDFDVYYKAFTEGGFDLGLENVEAKDAVYMGDMIFLIDNRDTTNPNYFRMLDGDVVTIYGTFYEMVETTNEVTDDEGEGIALYMKYADLISE